MTLPFRETEADDVNFTDQLDFDGILGCGAVDDGHHGVRLGRSEADCQQIDVGIRSFGLAERECHQSAELPERIRDAVCFTETEAAA